MEFVIIICALFIFVSISITLIEIGIEYTEFNGGVCPKCGKPLVKVDIDLQGDRGYYCYKCKHAVLVKFRWIDKNFKNKS